MRLIAYAFCVAVAAYLIAAAALFLMQDRMLLPATPPAPDARTLPHAGQRIDLWQAGAGHAGFAGYLVTPSRGAPRGTVIVYHGNEESADTKLPLAQVFVRAGYRVVLVEYPGHGRRAGERTLRAALAASREALAATLARWHAPVYLVGESLGAGMASRAVQGNEAAIAGVVLITPWDSLASVAAEKYPMFPVRWLLHDPFDSVAAVSRYAGPLVIVGALRDTLIPVQHARRFADAHAGSHLMLLPEAGHDDWFDSMSTPRWAQVRAWLGM